MADAMPGTNTTAGANTLTVDVAGNYAVNFMLVLQSTSGTMDITAGVTINGSLSELSLITSTALTASFEIINISSIVTLAAGDTLSLTLSSVAGGSILFGPSTHASLTAMRLGA